MFYKKQNYILSDKKKTILFYDLILQFNLSSIDNQYRNKIVKQFESILL